MRRTSIQKELEEPSVVTRESTPILDRRLSDRVRLAIDVLLCFPIGVFAGITGVGGGEYRTPILLEVHRDTRVAIASNLMIGTVASLFVFLLRQGQTAYLSYLPLAVVFIVSSVPGGHFGASLSGRFPDRLLRLLLASILFVAGVRLLMTPSLTVGSNFQFTWENLLIGISLGFMLGLVSGLLGVAGGEYRIPTFVLLFAVPVKTAGTLSSLVSVPVQTVSYWKHRRLGHHTGTIWKLTALMTVSTVAGVALGVVYLAVLSNALVSETLGILMIFAAIKLVSDVRATPSRSTSTIH